MKYQTLLLVFVGLMLPQAALADFDSTGQPLQCIGTDTFYPRGDRWVEPPGGTINLRFQPDGPTNQTGATALPGDIANQTIFNAFNVWSGVTCANGLQPDLRFALGAGYPTRDSGYIAATGTYQTVIYFAVSPGDQWPVDSLTVADTANHYYDVTYNEQAADMILNNINFKFRTTAASGAAYGCNPNDSACYDLETVALHEVGHFLGFNHVACTNAVMFPSATNTSQVTTLSHHEQGGVCALYPPRTYAGTTTSTMGESCASVNDCLKGLSCLKPPNSPTSAPTGWCAESCSSTNDCPIGWTCGPQGGSANVCQPGVHLSGIPVTAAVQANLDMCAPCSDGSQCLSDICGIDPANGNGICTQSCSAPSYACPENFACVASQGGPSICWPNSQGTCASIYQGAAIDALCYLPASVSGASSDLSRTCAGNGQCFIFPASSTGDCVQPCTAGAPGAVCASGFTCCFDLDSTGHCVTSEANKPVGGCFQIRRPGQLCTTPDLSVCEQGSQCLSNTTTTDSAECYRVCAGEGTNTGCAVGETCVTSGTQPLCCDASRYDGTNLSTCWPVPAACTREVGVTCASNSDCTSNFCLKGASGSVCTTQCSTSNDCPAAGTDVNGDGQGDGGTTCQTVGSQNVCVPIGTIAAAPACAATATSSGGGGGGGCTTVAVQDFAWSWAIVAMAWAARRAKARAA